MAYHLTGDLIILCELTNLQIPINVSGQPLNPLAYNNYHDLINSDIWIGVSFLD